MPGQDPILNCEPIANSPGTFPILPVPITPIQPFPGGQQWPVDQNGRPIIQVAQVPAEYDCPLFENRPYEALNQAIDALTYSMNSSPECQQTRATLDSVKTNTEAIRTAIASMQGFLQNPETAYDNIAVLEQGVTSAIQSANNIGELFNNNALLAERCGREVMSSGKVLVALTDILNGLAPFALLAVALNPAMGMAAKFALTGGAIATSSISTMVKMVEQGTVDMTNPEHRRAVLKNTCQFTKIARKVRFLQLAHSGQIQKIGEDLDRRIQLFNQRYSTTSPELGSLLTYREGIERMAVGIEQQARKDEFELRALESQIKEAGQDELFVCVVGLDLVKRSSRTDLDLFPATIRLNLDQAEVLAQPADTIQLQSVKLNHDLNRQRLKALETRVIEEDDGGAIKMCSERTRSLVQNLRQMQRLISQMTNAERAEVERELEQNLDYIAWREQYRRLQEERVTVSRVSRVMQELAKDNSVIDRSELDQRLMRLRGALFGVHGKWNWGMSPVLAWLDHTSSLHGNRVSSLLQNVRQLQTAAVEMVRSQHVSTPRSGTLAQERQVEVQAALKLENLTVSKIPIGTRGHEITCQQLETAWLDWTGAIDHLGATQFMCDMVDPYMDNKVEAKLTDFCRGQISLDGRQLRPSRLQTTVGQLTEASRGSNQISIRDWAQIVGKKLNELQCPTPGVTVLN